MQVLGCTLWGCLDDGMDAFTVIMRPRKKKRTIYKTAIVVTSLYLSAIIVSLALMFMTKGDTAMSGIFLVLVTMPWPLVLSWIQKALHFDSVAMTTLLLVAGGLVNSLILYKVISLLTGNSTGPTKNDWPFISSNLRETWVVETEFIEGEFCGRTPFF